MFRTLSFALVFAVALTVPQSTRAARSRDVDSSVPPRVTLDPVRARWPIAREPGGQWGVVGEVVASHARPAPVTVRAVTVTLRDDAGRLLALRRYEDAVSLSGVLRIATSEGDPARWRPAGTASFGRDERAVAFVGELVATRPGWATITFDLEGQRPESALVPLSAYPSPQRFTWPTASGGRPWIATSTAGTPPHSQGGAVLNAGRLFVSQRFALDLRQVDEELRTHPLGATQKEAYYAWGQPVVSLGRGRVVAVVQDDPDYDIAAVIPPTQHPAGNYVVVQYGPTAFGVYAHLQRGSVIVARDQWVERGQALALVGNSGNTSEPHLHVHVADRWLDGSDPLASFVLSQGVPALFWGADVYRDGVWLPLRGTTPTEFDIVAAGGACSTTTTASCSD